MLPLELTIENLLIEAANFAQQESQHDEPLLFGVTDGKAVGTYVEHKFRNYLKASYRFIEGSSASGIDFPELLVDLKVTSIRQPQSSCPYKAARQKIYGLGYALLVFVYDKQDEPLSKTSRLQILHTVFVEAHRTGDFQMTRGLNQLLQNEANRDDVMAFLMEKSLPVDEIELARLADEIFQNPPLQGFLTISNALQWRLQYGRAIEMAGNQEGVLSVFRFAT
jgi:hypothetical protein